MSRKIVEDIVLDYFQNATLEFAETMHRIAGATLKRRRKKETQAPVRKARKQSEKEQPDSSSRPVNGPQPV